MNSIKSTFLNIKNYLKTKEGQIINKYFNVIGYKYTSTILNNNFFHFATEALLISLTKELNKENYSEGVFPKEFLTMEIKQEEYLSNVEFLIGSNDNCDSQSEIMFCSRKLSEIFLNNFNEERKKNNSQESISYIEFESILRQVVNKSINELSGNENQQLLKVYLECEKKYGKNKEFSLSDFIKEHTSLISASSTKNEDKKEKQNFCLRNSCELFYYFAQTTIEEYLSDLICFNQQSSSIIYLIIGFIKFNYCISMEKLKMFYLYSEKKYTKGKENVILKANQMIDFSKIQLNDLSKWVQKSYTTANDSFKDKFPTVHSNICFLNNTYISPFTLKLSNIVCNTYTISLKYCKQGHEKYQKLKDELVEYVSSKYDLTKETASKYISITKERIGNNTIVKITIQKFNESKESLINVVSKGYDLVSKFDLEFSFKYAKQGKDFILQSYHKFLGCSEEENEICDEENEEKKELIKEN